MVDGGKQFAAKHRHDARVVHAELVALIRGLLRQVQWGGETGREWCMQSWWHSYGGCCGR